MHEDSLRIRIIHLRKSLEMNQREFSDLVGISQGTLSLLENGKTRLSLETLKRFLDKTKVNPYWLLSGKGDMLEEQEANKSKGQSISIFVNHLIPLIRLEVQAGYLKGQYEDKSYKEKLDWYKIPGFLDSKYRMFQIEGDSMKHVLYPDDIVITEECKLDDVEPGKIYVIVTEKELVAKRIYTNGGDNHLILRSENPDFKPYTLKKEDVIELWMIQGKITKELVGLDSAYGERISRLEESIETIKDQMNKLLENGR